MPGNDHGIPWEAEMDFEPAKRPRLEKTDATASFETSNFAGCFFDVGKGWEQDELYDM